MSRILLSATGLFTPAESISNEELVASFNEYVRRFNQQHAATIEDGTVEALEPSSTSFIEKASGIRSRFVLDKQGVLDPDRMCPRLPERPDEELSILAEIATAAGADALRRADCPADSVDAVIVACSNLQRAYPAIAIEVQSALGAATGFAFDMNVACSSSTFAVQSAVGLIRSGSAERILICNPEICSGHLDFRDRDAHFIFGDVATAMLIEAESAASPSSSRLEILGTRCLTQFSNNIRNNFGFLDRTHAGDPGGGTVDDAATGRPSDRLFRQSGHKVFKEVSPLVARTIAEHLDEVGVDASDLRRLWLHQANVNMNQLIARKVLGRDPEATEAPVILDRYANTSSAGSVIALHLHSDDFQPGDVGLLCSFGAGYSVGSVVLRKSCGRSRPTA